MVIMGTREPLLYQIKSSPKIPPRNLLRASSRRTGACRNAVINGMHAGPEKVDTALRSSFFDQYGNSETMTTFASLSGTLGLSIWSDKQWRIIKHAERAKDLERRLCCVCSRGSLTAHESGGSERMYSKCSDSKFWILVWAGVRDSHALHPYIPNFFFHRNYLGFRATFLTIYNPQPTIQSDLVQLR